MHDRGPADNLRIREQTANRYAKDLGGSVDLVEEQSLVAALDIAGSRAGYAHGRGECVLSNPLPPADRFEAHPNLASQMPRGLRGSGLGDHTSHTITVSWQLYSVKSDLKR